jgi:2,5-diketo-D-gluconate reductase B
MRESSSTLPAGLDLIPPLRANYAPAVLKRSHNNARFTASRSRMAAQGFQGVSMDYFNTQGIRMPRLGFGTFRMQGDVCRAAVESALALGYRHLDTAEMYANEEEVGAAIAASGVPRSELHVTTKVWNENLAPDAMRRAFDASLKKLRLDVLDLYLVHWPKPGMHLPSMLETMMKLKEEGRTRAIGVANFNIALLRTVVEEIKAPIACNQIEYHVMLDQTKIKKYMDAHKIPLVAYCPLVRGQAGSDETMMAIGKKHNASVEQVALKWLLDQDGVGAIPKASRRENQQANLDALKVRLDDDDRRKIASLPKNKRFVAPGFSPAWD